MSKRISTSRPPNFRQPTPTYYNPGGEIEVVKALEDWDLGLHRGNAVMCIVRAGRKDPMREKEDIEQAIYWLERDLALLERRKK